MNAPDQDARQGELFGATVPTPWGTVTPTAKQAEGSTSATQPAAQGSIVQQYRKRHGKEPTCRTVALEFIVTTQTAWEFLRALRRKGALPRGRGRAA